MIARTVITLCLAISLSGCGKWLDDVFYKSDRLQARDWAAFGAPYTPKPVYCYKTLAAPDCYAEEQPNRKNQLLEAYDQPQPALIPLTNRERDFIIREDSFVEAKPIHLGH
jgi:hypothetical protein